MSVLGLASRGLSRAFATIAARPGLFLLFAAVQCGSNLMRFWLGRVEAQAGGDSVIAAVGWLFLIARTFATQWLHVAAARVTDAPGVSLRHAFAVTGRQALWFHGLILVSMATFLVRLWLSRASGGFFAPDRDADLREVVLLTAGFAITYLAFLPLIPGYFAAILGEGRPTLRWSLRAARGRILPALAAAMLLALGPALVRRWLLAFVMEGDPLGIAATAILDAVLTVLLMMLATAIYWGLYRDAVAGKPAVPLRPAEAVR